jgi:hypothetical protein
MAFDWCEANYVHSPSVAEACNTLSSGAFAAVAYWLLYQSPRKIPLSFILLLGSLSVASGAYHAQLTDITQLLDEVLIVVFILRLLREVRCLFTLEAGIFLSVVLPCMVWRNDLSAFAMMATCAPLMYRLCLVANRAVTAHPKITTVTVYHLTQCLSCTSFACGCWLTEKYCYYLMQDCTLCGMLHSCWHVSISKALFHITNFAVVVNVSLQHKQITSWDSAEL